MHGIVGVFGMMNTISDIGVLNYITQKNKNMNSLRFKITDETKFNLWIERFKEFGILGDFITIGTSLDCGSYTDELKYMNDGSDDSFLEFNVSLEENRLVEAFPKSFHYNNLLVSITTKWDVDANDVGEKLCPDEIVFISDIEEIIERSV